MKYKDALTLDKEILKEVLAPLRVQEMKVKSELELCKLDGAIADQESKIFELTSEYPIKFEKLMGAIDEIDLYCRRKQRLQEILQQIFED